jgi:hypothetical protein
LPNIIPYQGTITNTTGRPFSGTFDFVFKVRNTVGTELWSSGVLSLDVVRGVYTVQLGKSPQTVIPKALWSNDWIELEVSFDDGVNGLETLSPNVRILPVPYALRAYCADSLASGEAVFGEIQSTNADFDTLQVRKQFVTHDITEPTHLSSQTHYMIWDTTGGTSNGLVMHNTSRINYALGLAPNNLKWITNAEMGQINLSGLNFRGNFRYLSTKYIRDPDGDLTKGFVESKLGILAASGTKQSLGVSWHYSDPTVSSLNGTHLSTFTNIPGKKVFQDVYDDGTSSQVFHMVDVAGDILDWQNINESSIVSTDQMASVISMNNTSRNVVYSGSDLNTSKAVNVAMFPNLGRIDLTANTNVLGNLSVGGTISKASGSFKIDHPSDPYNKILYHSFIESPDMMNVYNGNIVTDEKGKAKIELPSYFSDLNEDFRYQLTCIGTLATAVVSEEIKDNVFYVKTDKPSVKVSWQVTGIRKDPYATENRIQVEVDKPSSERGTLMYTPRNPN